MSLLITWLATESERDLLGGDITTDYYQQITIDGTASEAYNVEAMATEHPVEDAADIADHVKPALRHQQFEIVISAHPGPTSAAHADLGEADAPAQRPANVRDTLERLILEGIEVDIESGIGAWESMLLLGLAETRRPETGDGLRATLMAREFRRVSTEEVEAPSPRVERGRSTRDRGEQTGESAETPPVANDDRSWYARLADLFP